MLLSKDCFSRVCCYVVSIICVEILCSCYCCRPQKTQKTFTIKCQEHCEHLHIFHEHFHCEQMYVSVTLSPTVPTPVAPAADVESSSLERCTTAPPSGVVMKTQPLVSSAPPVRRTPAAVAAASPAPLQTEEDDVDYDSDDSSKTIFGCFGLFHIGR